MKMQKITAMLLAGVMCVTGIFANGSLVRAADGTAEVTSSARVEEILSGMTTRQKITQMMMPDFRYWDEDLTDDAGQVGVTEVNSQIEQIVKDYDFGGVILFAQNVKETAQTLNLTKQYQAAATADGGTPLLISIDQEGGSVYRLGTGTALPGNMAVGATGSVDYARKNGEIIGRELSSLGINCNFAPVMDVNNNPNNPVIGLRSFSDDPQTVADMGVAMIEGMNEYNIAASAKHFLGHGDTGTDSHTGLPVVDKSREEMEAMELVPFKAAMAAGVDMFMTAHIVYPQIDGTKVVSQKTGEEVNLPATLSKKILTDLVRGDLGYKGVLITDAMNMAGVSGNFGQVEASIRAIQAGVDILLMPCVLYNLEDLKDLDAIIEGIEAAVADGSIPVERLDESCRRILGLKEKRGILDYDASALTEEKALEQVGSAENREIEREMSAAAVTVVKNENDTLPVKLTKDSKVLFLTPWDNEPALLAMGWNRAKEEGLVPVGAECKTICTTYQSNITAEMQAALEWADTVIAVSEIGSNAYLNPANWGHFHYSIPEQATAYCKENGKKSIVMSVDKPYDIQFYENADAVLAVYGCMGSSADPTEILNGGITTTAEAFGPNMTAGVEVIFGVFGASGTLPVNVNRLDMETKTYTDEIVYARGTGLTYPAVEVEPIQRRINNMTTRQKITQMMMPDFRYWDEDLTDDVGQKGVTEVNSQIEQVVKDYDFGGVILFAQNVTGTTQTLNLTKQYQAAATADGGTPLLIGIDQEGGSVYRLGTGTALPGNMAVGATGSIDYARMNGQIIGRELNSLGINCNFAPVMDVNNNPNNPVIGLRSFSDDPQTVANMGVAMIEGMNEYNIAASAKHFLGHGDTGTDSHTGLPVVDKSREELEAMELVPFKAAMAADVDMFMTAHIVYPQIDDTKVVSQKTGEEVNLPATLSKKILTDLVRGDLGYKGVLITDAMNMAGVSGNFGQVEASIRAIQAGVDILLMPCVLYNLEDLADLDAIIAGIEAAVADGTISEERLNESCERILKLKEKRGILDYDGSVLTEENALEQVGSEENRAIEREMAAAAVTVVKNENNVLPLKLNTKSKVLFLTPYANELPCVMMGWTRAQQAGVAPIGAECKAVRFSSSSNLDTAAIKEGLEWADTVIVNSEVSSARNMQAGRWVTKFPTDVSDYCRANGKTSVIMSVDKPYDVQHYVNADAVLAVYGCKGSSADPTEILNGGITTTEAAFGPNITAGVEVAFGVFGASGKLPVNIYRFDETTGSYTEEIVYARGEGLSYAAVEPAPADKAAGLILAIGEVSYTEKCEKAIRAAQEYYDSLSAEEQAQVVNYGDLVTATSKYYALKAEAESGDAQAAQEAAEAAKAEAEAAKAEAEQAMKEAQAASEDAEMAMVFAEKQAYEAEIYSEDAEQAAKAAEAAQEEAAAKAEAAQAAQAAAEAAKAAAEAAQQKAEEAEDTTGMYAVAAEAAQTKAEAAQEAAEAAKAAAEAAQTKAEAAKEGAEAAELKAEAAKTEAEAAQTKAEAAQTKAEAAAGTAEAAQEYAEAAKTAAETAQTAAEAAAEAAGASAEDAAEAQSKAEAAKTAAEAAQAKAETAKTAAETAKTAAEAAQEAAEAAIDAAEAEADAAKEAKQAAQMAQVKAEAAQAKAEATIEKAEAARAKAEAAQTKAEAAQALAEAAAERAKDEAERAKDEAEKAKAEAEKAEAEAEKAKAEVEKAKAEAETAKAEAEKAKAEAEKAKAEIENVKAEVEKAREEAAKAKAEAQKAAAAAATAQKTLLEIKITQTQKPAAVKITVNKKKFTVKRGKKARIKAKASDGSRLKFKSSNKKVAKVTSKGVIKAVKKGKAVITIKAGKVTKKVKVFVKK